MNLKDILKPGDLTLFHFSPVKNYLFGFNWITFFKSMMSIVMNKRHQHLRAVVVLGTKMMNFFFWQKIATNRNLFYKFLAFSHL